ncbi:MAG: hypothetical protein FWD87_08905 [Spirochaetaceae bacterium]|nr:hypothetical protein [Spirochaetaceae bacterium]
MKKKYFIFFCMTVIIILLSSVNPLFAQTSNIPYWYLDVTVDNRLLGTFTQQRVFFFRDLRSMEALTGFPRCDLPGSNSSGYRWRQPQGSIPIYIQQIFSVMREQGFGAAFTMDTSGTNIRGTRYWNYSVFLMNNGVGFFDMKTRYNNPVSF